MYKKFMPIHERDRRIYMAGLSFTQLIGWKSAREYCQDTVLAIGDIDTDDMLFFSNSIDRDVEDVEHGNTERFSDYFDVAVNVYVREDHKDAANKFFSREHLRESFERGRMTDSIEYPCVVEGSTVWIRACYELEQDDNGHVQCTVVLIDITRLRTSDAE